MTTPIKSALDAVREAVNFGSNPFRDGTRMFTSHEMKRSDAAAKADEALEMIEALLTRPDPAQGKVDKYHGWYPMITAPKDSQYIRVLCENGKEDICHWSLGEWSSEYGEGEPVKWYPALPEQHLTEIRKHEDKLALAVDALEEAKSLAASVSVSKYRKVIIDDEEHYAQTKEWCDWASEEVLTKICKTIAAIKGETNNG